VTTAQACLRTRDSTAVIMLVIKGNLVTNSWSSSSSRMARCAPVLAAGIPVKLCMGLEHLTVDAQCRDHRRSRMSVLGAQTRPVLCYLSDHYSPDTFVTGALSCSREEGSGAWNNELQPHSQSTWLFESRLQSAAHELLPTSCGTDLGENPDSRMAVSSRHQLTCGQRVIKLFLLKPLFPARSTGSPLALHRLPG
jgi:hypothetical protein